MLYIIFTCLIILIFRILHILYTHICLRAIPFQIKFFSVLLWSTLSTHYYLNDYPFFFKIVQKFFSHLRVYWHQASIGISTIYSYVDHKFSKSFLTSLEIDKVGTINLNDILVDSWLLTHDSWLQFNDEYIEYIDDGFVSITRTQPQTSSILQYIFFKGPSSWRCSGG